MKRRRSTLPPLASLGDPPAVRLVNQSVMRSEWVDPDAFRPTAARTAKTIAGWRTYCPLRRMLGVKGTSVTVEHVMAADKLRQAADGIVFGFSGRREILPV